MTSGLVAETNIITKNMGVVKLQTIVKSEIEYVNLFNKEISFDNPKEENTVKLTLNTGDTLTIAEDYPLPTDKGCHVLAKNSLGVRLLAYDNIHNDIIVQRVDHNSSPQLCYPPKGISSLLITPDCETFMGVVIYV